MRPWGPVNNGVLQSSYLRSEHITSTIMYHWVTNNNTSSSHGVSNQTLSTTLSATKSTKKSTAIVCCLRNSHSWLREHLDMHKRKKCKEATATGPQIFWIF